MATRSEPFSLEMLTFGHPESSGTLGSVRWTRGGVKIGLGRPWDTKRQNPRELGRFLRKELTFFWWVTKPGFFGSPGGGSKAQYLPSYIYIYNIYIYTYTLAFRSLLAWDPMAWKPL